MEKQTKLSETRVAFTLPAAELAALDEYCAALRRQIGDRTGRAEVIRQAIRAFIAGVPG